MTEFVPGLPVPLLLLVHLHLLEYPLANNPEYDQSLFDPNVRRLRDRTKSMEDMCYFLVGKVEGRKESAKAILSTYPCLAPGDTTAFRTSLAKYLESLRQNAIYPKILSGSVDVSSRDKGKGKEIAPEAMEAWWWKDVFVRKSLLEECAGERFERLLLALSTHTLFKCTSGSESVPSNAAFESTMNLFRVQPQTYTALLASSQSTWHSWERSASLLQQRKDNLISLRDHLAPHSVSTPSKYEALATEKLLALTDAKLQDLSRDFWPGMKGRQALDFLIELAGLQRIDADNSIPTKTSSTVGGPEANSISQDLKGPTLPVQPLPIAAAHHPSYLRKLRASIIAPPKKSTLAVDTDVNANAAAEKTKTHAEISLSAQVNAERTMKNALQDALSLTARTGQELRGRLCHARETQRDKADNQSIMNLWRDDDSQRNSVDFGTKPTPELLSSAAAYQTSPSNPLESRVSHVQGSLLPAYPPIPKPISQPPPLHLLNRTSSFSEAPAHIYPLRSDLDQPSVANGTVNEDETPRTPRPLITSTPPASVKPRSAYVRRILASQSKEKSKSKGRVEFVVSGSAGLRKSRKSVRMSLAMVKRPSLFGPPLSDEEDVANIENRYGDDVDQIIDAVHDNSTFFANSYMTPKITRLPSPYKFRSCSPFKKPNTTPGPRPSFEIVERLSLAPLPDDKMSADDLSHETSLLDATDADDNWVNEDDMSCIDCGNEAEDNGEEYEGKSITLRDILLQAGDTTRFDLLDGGGFNLDGSIAWE